MAEIAAIDDLIVSGEVIQSGLIFMWHGTLANIPAGYVLCDGNNGTPNLLDQFIQEVVNASTDPGATGGATAKSSTNHQHTCSSHTHYYNFSGGGYNISAGPINFWYTEATSICFEGHGHNCTAYAAIPGNMTNGAEAWTDGRPKFYAVAFIMKT